MVSGAKSRRGSNCWSRSWNDSRLDVTSEASLDRTLVHTKTQGNRGEAGGGMDAKNVVQVQIFGHGYTIRGEADQDYITSVAAYVDRKMREITEKLPVASLSKVAILASLNIADELFKERARRETEERD